MPSLGSIIILMPFLMAVAAVLPLVLLIREPRSTLNWRRRRGGRL